MEVSEYLVGSPAFKAKRRRSWACGAQRSSDETIAGDRSRTDLCAGRGSHVGSHFAAFQTSSTGAVTDEYNEAMSFDRISVDPDRMGGLPCIRDLRITVAMVLGQLAAGRTTQQVLEDYPYLEPEDISAALAYGAARVNERDLPLARPA